MLKWLPDADRLQFGSQVFFPVFQKGTLEDYTLAMDAWRAIIRVFAADPQLAAKPRVRMTTLNPIEFTIGSLGADKIRVSLPT